LLEANATEAVQDGRIHIEEPNGPFLFKEGGSPAEYMADLELAIARGWLWKHEVRNLREIHPSRRRTVRLMPWDREFDQVLDEAKRR
jgi:hypothetical protein